MTASAGSRAAAEGTAIADGTMPDTARRRAPGPRAAGLLLLLLFLVGGGALAGLRANHHPALSVADEFAHLDSLDKASRLRPLRTGQTVDLLTMRIESCRGIEPGGGTPPPCDGSYVARDYQVLGVNTADIHPPTYYLLTGLPARAVAALAPDNRRDEFFLATGRVLGGVWLGLGCWVLWRAAALLAVPVAFRATAVAVVATAPAVLRFSAIVSPDVTGVLAGALVLLAVIHHLRGEWGLVRLAAVGAVVVALKVPNLLAVLAGGVALLAAALTPGALPGRRDSAAADGGPRSERLRAGVVPAAVLVGAGVLSEAVWLVARAATALPGVGPNALALAQQANGLKTGQVTSAYAAFTPVLGAPVGTSGPLAAGHDLLLGLLSWGLLGAALALVLLGSKSQAVGRACAWGGLTVVVVGGPFLVLATYLSQKVYVVIPPRYGASLLPFLVIPALVALPSGAARICVVAASALLTLSALVLLVRTAAL